STISNKTRKVAIFCSKNFLSFLLLISLELRIFELERDVVINQPYPKVSSSMKFLPTRLTPFFNRGVTINDVFSAASRVLSQSGFPNSVKWSFTSNLQTHNP
ncbi:hypothetical protein PanWU01x14_195550, partial [Parasponia andersonii]